MNEIAWHPTATLENLQKRAILLAKVREFFSVRQVLEVETPLLAAHSVSDPYLVPFISHYQAVCQANKQVKYLQTSPEYAMKRLLAAGSGSIYQLCKAFRNEERGVVHNPEFTLLEWYRVGFDHHQLMQEVDALLQSLLNTKPADIMTYRQLFLDYCELDVAQADLKTCQAYARAHGLSVSESMSASADKDDWLQLIMHVLIEPHIGKNKPLFIHAYPSTQAALAQIIEDEQTGLPVAARFEVYYQGLELANGYHELTNEKEQRARMKGDNVRRQQLGLPFVEPDPYLLQALQVGLPDCAGVAMGFDRMAMLACLTNDIRDVLSFQIDNA